MLIKNIPRTLPSINSKQTIGEVLHLFQLHEVLHISVVNEKSYIGILSFEKVEHLDPTTKIDQITDLFSDFVFESEPFYKIWLFLSLNNLTIVPLVDFENHYVGTLKTQDLVIEIEKQFDLKEEGSIIVFTIKKVNYSLAIVASIAEELHIQIEHFFLLRQEEQEEVIISVRINTNNVEQFKNALTRHNNEIVMIYTTGNKFDSLKERYDELMYYLNV